MVHPANFIIAHTFQHCKHIYFTDSEIYMILILLADEKRVAPCGRLFSRIRFRTSHPPRRSALAVAAGVALTAALLVDHRRLPALRAQVAELEGHLPGRGGCACGPRLRLLVVPRVQVALLRPLLSVCEGVHQRLRDSRRPVADSVRAEVPR